MNFAPSSVFAAHQVWRGRWAYALLALFALILFLPGIASLPPTDRDEARFSQASRQMVETGNYIDIRFQNEARNKKPVGIYWLQAASAKLFGKDKIWPYRLPSLLGALGTVLALAALAKPAFGREAGLIAGFFMAGSLLLTVESHLAKTDAMLLLTVVVAQLALARVYLRSRTGAPIALSMVLLFWFAQGAGILIKGPVTPLISILTIVTLSIADRIAGIRSGFAARLRPAIGIPLALLIAAPWFIAVSLGDSAFLKEAVGQDLLPKLIGGQEAHGAPPGYYLLTITLTFWPASLLAWPAVIWGWRNRREPALRFLLAWLIPGWILFELIPTKLPHYVLPLLPAVALMAGLALRDAPAALAATLRSWAGRALIVLWALLGLALGALLLDRHLALRASLRAAGTRAARRRADRRRRRRNGGLARGCEPRGRGVAACRSADVAADLRPAAARRRFGMAVAQRRRGGREAGYRRAAAAGRGGWLSRAQPGLPARHRHAADQRRRARPSIWRRIPRPSR